MIYYRFENRGVDDYLTLDCRTYPVSKETPQGIWIDTFGVPRFILNVSVKKFAYPTKELALESFQARKRRQIAILAAQLRGAEQALALSLTLDLKDPEPLLLGFHANTTY